MLDAAVLLQIWLGDYAEVGVVALLLLTNAALGFFQEGRGQATLDVLKSRMALVAALRWDDAWTRLPVAALVLGDLIKLSLGGVVAADIRPDEGSVLIDQSMLTAERKPLWRSRPGHWLLMSSAIDLGPVSALALTGALMAPLGKREQQECSFLKKRTKKLLVLAGVRTYEWYLQLPACRRHTSANVGGRRSGGWIPGNASGAPA